VPDGDVVPGEIPFRRNRCREKSLHGGFFSVRKVTVGKITADRVLDAVSYVVTSNRSVTSVGGFDVESLRVHRANCSNIARYERATFRIRNAQENLKRLSGRSL